MLQATLICDDAQEALQKISPQSIDCVVTSPPYFNQRDYQTGYWIGGDPNCDHMRRKTRFDLNNHKPGKFNGWKQGAPHYGYIMYNKQCKKCGALRVDSQIGIEDSITEYLERLSAVFDQIKRVLKKEGTVFVIIEDVYYYKSKTPVPTLLDKNNQIQLKYREGTLMLVPYLLAMYLMNNGWYIRQLIVWHKPNALPEPSCKRFTHDYEIIIFATQTMDYFFNNDFATEISPETGKTRRTRAVWSIPVGQSPGTHSAAMPISIAEKCIAVGCPSGGTVLDPFCGSGTTLVAALKNGRNAVGIDLSSKYIHIAKERIQKETGVIAEVYLNEKQEQEE